jgi:T5SS/PEP-CTERM-associated repeat protein
LRSDFALLGVKTNFNRRICAARVTLLLLALPGRTYSQFTDDYQTNIVNGTAVNWPRDYYVGSNYVSDALFILNGGSLSNNWGYIGFRAGDASNLAVVSGSGSAWTNMGHLYVGYSGSANRLVINDGGKVMALGDTVAASTSGSISNSILVTGSGSVLTNRVSLYVGDGGAYCSLVISNGGAVFCRDRGYVGGNFGGRSNIALVTGSGSVWQCGGSMTVGFRDGNMLIVSNGGAVFNTEGRVGYFGNARSNSVLITGNGSRWENTRTLYVGYGVGSGTDASNNRLTIADGGSVVASNAYVGFTAISSNSLLHLSGGNLTVTNLSATGFLDVQRGALTFNSGTVRVDQLWLTRGVHSVLEFNGGTLHSKGTVISNATPCVVGDGVASANFHLLGGVHSFRDGLRIRGNSFLTGCGTINGSVIIDAGGALHVNCTNLVFNSSVTNNGAMVVDGAVLETFDTFVNNGKIFLLNGGTTNFHGLFINNGAILNGDVRLTIARDGSSGLVIRYTGPPHVTYRLQRAGSLTGPWSDIATNTAPASGLVEFHETSSPPGQTFYRTLQR